MLGIEPPFSLYEGIMLGRGSPILPTIPVSLLVDSCGPLRTVLSVAGLGWV